MPVNEENKYKIKNLLKSASGEDFHMANIYIETEDLSDKELRELQSEVNKESKDYIFKLVTIFKREAKGH